MHTIMLVSFGGKGGPQDGNIVKPEMNIRTSGGCNEVSCTRLHLLLGGLLVNMSITSKVQRGAESWG